MFVFSKRDLEEGKKLLKEKKIKNVIFSGGTYQLEVGKFWPFLQLSDLGEVIDSLCSCPAAQKKGVCPHLAAAHLKIMNGQDLPLHVRFRESLWNKLCFLFFKSLGTDSKTLKDASLRLDPFKKSGEKKLKDILYDRPVETEETSLKFSNLSLEELNLWREGKPNEQLKYELSFWSDIAKWLMFCQEENEKYQLTFSGQPIPDHILVHFPEIEIESDLDEQELSEIIPTLQKVDSPLTVYPYSRGTLKKILFRSAPGKLHLEFEEKEEEKTVPEPKQEGLPVGEWIYVKEVGFFPIEEDPLFQLKEIPKERIDEFFESHLRFIQKHLEGETIHETPTPVRYSLEFDEKTTLHICPFVFEKGDLQKKGAHYFGNWVYLPDNGFFLLENQLFRALETQVPKEEISEFIKRNRVFLGSIEGFQTHVSGVESHLGYRFNEKGNLTFYTRLEFTEEEEHMFDLGEWIYVKDKGFYAKVTARSGALQPGLEVAHPEISSFIQKYHDELEPIHGFFAFNCPLEKTGLNIDFTQDKLIQITPEYFFTTGYIPEKVQIFGDYTYVEKEGFFHIPQMSRLPENCRDERIIDPLSEAYFVGYELQILIPHVISIDPKLKRPKKLDLRLNHLKRDPSAKTGQWILELSYESDIGKIIPHAIWDGHQNSRPYLFTDAGLLFLRDSRYEWLKKIGKKKWLKKGRLLRLTTLEFLKLLTVETLLEPEEKGKRADATRQLLQNFLTFKAPSEIDLTGLQSDLRPYQKTGAHWLWFLQSYGLSGMLCDEMGLGKTHQAMALIAGVINDQKQRRPKFLVVCPTSVIYHWENLINRFLPHVRPYIFHGIGRRFEDFSEDSYDLLLTSYGIVRTEKEALSNFHFDIAIFDELQIAKNEKSITHKALRSISASMRLGLTGTPIENRLLELKALFDITIPGYFPTTSAFREHFIGPIERYHDEEKRLMLTRLIHPFMLRRKKSEVLLELPEKIEEIAYCDLSAEQSKLYEEIFMTNQKQLLSELQDESKPPPITHVFALLTKLKQVCDHPCLITKDKHNYKNHSSGKWDLFVELLDEVRDSGQKLVVFSQYLDMLDIIEMHLKEHKIGFAGIRGSTKDRKQQVERFTQDPTCEVFLGSLQAAGVGIDLISASVVFHYDRWWNPAKENQATDRVHRMGQKRGVQVFKMVTKNTIEQHIHNLIESKRSLTEKVIGFDSHDQVKGLERQELIKLMQMIGSDIRH